MTYFIHRSQIVLYLQENGLSELQTYTDVSLAEHGTKVEWNLGKDSLIKSMTFDLNEQVFIIE